MSDFWKIQCAVCGANSDLLTDPFQRVICREHLREFEFNEVESEIYATRSKQVQAWRKKLLRLTSDTKKDDCDSRDDGTEEIPIDN